MFKVTTEYPACILNNFQDVILFIHNLYTSPGSFADQFAIILLFQIG